MRDKKLRQEILALENEVKELEKTLGAIKQRLLNLKDLAWDKQSKKESSSMYKVLKEDKTHTMVKSDVGDIKVDKDFMEKEIRKHLDNPNLRGMVTTKEMLSFPKVAKGVRAEFNAEHKDFTWKVKANDENILIYGSREYIQNNKAVNRLLTSYSQTEKGERINNSGNGQTKSAPPPLFKDSNFRRPTNEKIIPQNQIKENEREIEKTERGERGHSHRQINDPDFLRPTNEIISQKSLEVEKSYSQTERNERKAEEDRRGHPYHPIFNDLNFRKSANKEIIPQNKEYEVNKKDTNSETEKGQRKIEETGVGERGQLHQEFNDRNFLRPADNIDEIKNKGYEAKTNTLIDAIINARKDLNHTIRTSDILMQDFEKNTNVEFDKEDLKDNSQILQSEMTNTSKNINKRLKQ